MLAFSISKINLGLNILRKRPDGYHDLETVFYPIGWSDVLEILPGSGPGPELTQTGLPIPGNASDNLILRAWKELSKLRALPPMRIHLHKNVPMGAGLGGGSANAATFITLANRAFDLKLTNAEQLQAASAVGSDCAFFLSGKPAFGTGRGNTLSPVNLDLSSWWILTIFPGSGSSTSEAYAGLTPHEPAVPLKEVIALKPSQWKGRLVNDFEKVIFPKYPETKLLRDKLYDNGATYAALSGSGNAVFGIFDRQPSTSWLQEPATWWLDKPASSK